VHSIKCGIREDGLRAALRRGPNVGVQEVQKIDSLAFSSAPT